VDARFERVPFADIVTAVREHLAALPSTIDSFLEDHILESKHYRIVIGGVTAGFAAIHKERLITQISLAPAYRRYGQPVFAHLRRLEQVQSAFVPTCDEFFLAHALDDHRRLAMQAYFFTTVEDMPPLAPTGYRLRRAEPGNIELIQRESGDFFAPIERYVEDGELFLTIRDDEPVAFGLLDVSALYADVASIGMFTIERRRRQGAGAATIALLIAECRRRGLRPAAGCWYYNHASKRTLERAGMHAPARLLKIDY
jgi:GNAT superfamily N-acetyltransferase